LRSNDMIATLWVSPFTEIGIGGGLFIGLICLPLLLPFALLARTETGWLAGVALAVLGAAVLGVALWFGCWPLA